MELVEVIIYAIIAVAVWEVKFYVVLCGLLYIVRQWMKKRELQSEISISEPSTITSLCSPEISGDVHETRLPDADLVASPF